MLKHECHHLFSKFGDSRHVHLAKYAVFDEESDVQVKNKQFRSPGAKTYEKENSLKPFEKGLTHLLTPLKGQINQ